MKIKIGIAYYGQEGGFTTWKKEGMKHGDNHHYPQNVHNLWVVYSLPKNLQCALYFPPGLGTILLHMALFSRSPGSSASGQGEDAAKTGEKKSVYTVNNALC